MGAPKQGSSKIGNGPFWVLWRLLRLWVFRCLNGHGKLFNWGRLETCPRSEKLKTWPSLICLWLSDLTWKIALTPFPAKSLMGKRPMRFQLSVLKYTSGPKVVTIFVDVSFWQGFPHSLYGVLEDSPQTVFPLHFYSMLERKTRVFSCLSRSSTVDQGSTVLNRFSILRRS